MPTSACSYAVVHISGADATPFLHAQLTVDIHGLGADRQVLAAWCDAKGRVLCTGRLVPHEDEYLFLLPRALAAPMMDRLRMYVLRAQVHVADVSDQWTISGLTASDDLPANGALSRRGDTLVLGIDTGNGPGAIALSRTQPDGDTCAVIGNTWQLAEIDAGLPEVRAATSGLLVPQMLNLHWLGGVDFDKGCYPGQEIVARLQYRGQLKRRLFRLQWAGKRPQAGDDILDAGNQKQGTVIRSACTGGEAGRLLAVIHRDAGKQTLATAGARLDLLDLPYATGGS